MVQPCQFLKEILVNKLTLIALSFIVFVFFSSPAKSNDFNLCTATGVTTAFFNGVNTTYAEALAATHELKRLHGSTSPVGDHIRYEALYNYSNGFEDFVETFEQRLLEHDALLEGRFELFLDSINGTGKWWVNLKNSIVSLKGLIDSLQDWFKAESIRQLSSLLANPPTIENYEEHKTRIDNWVVEGRKLLFVAHSQGNLFVNSAYNHTILKAPIDSVKVIHIAPASATLNGEHTLADLDLVINGLRVTGSVPAITDDIPNYLSRPASIISGKKDILGHGLLEIYINQELDISRKIYEQINTALSSLVSPPAQATSGFFSATLTWDGIGDVDLHTIEPDLSHVYFSSKQGTSGYLDVDNLFANGPEHYYTSCDSQSLQTGTYQILVANYSRASGKTATVQIASWQNGVLGTRSVVLGNNTGSTPSHLLFNVNVSKNENTGYYSVTID